MSDHNLGEDAYLAYVATIPIPPECKKKWHELDPVREQRVWEKVAAAVTLRLCMHNLAGHHGPLPPPLFGPADPTAYALDPAIQLLPEERDAVQAAIAEIEHNAPKSCGRCGQPDACCDADCASAALCAKNAEVLRALLRRVGIAALKG